MKDDLAPLYDIVERIELAIDFAGSSKSAFLGDRKSQEAVIRELEVIGEASKRISEATRRLAPEVPWKKMAGFKDVAIHQYGSVDVERVWAIVEGDLPRVKSHIRRLLPRVRPRPPESS